jgi:L,D-peptidoglycan transpeptidase YkuD (ErfK/YbiS/YcfS/YnhG family)
MKIVVHGDGWLVAGTQAYRAAIGRGGISANKREGDGASPEGLWPLRQVMYRADRLGRPESNLPLREIRKTDGWCDAPGDPAYNRLVALPYAPSHEDLWRDDHVYDVIAVVGYNDDPPRAGLGSAIFLHVAQPDYAPTAGCAALALDDLLNVLAECGPGSTLEFTNAPRR